MVRLMKGLGRVRDPRLRAGLGEAGMAGGRWDGWRWGARARGGEPVGASGSQWEPMAGSGDGFFPLRLSRLVVIRGCPSPSRFQNPTVSPLHPLSSPIPHPPRSLASSLGQPVWGEPTPTSTTLTVSWPRREKAKTAASRVPQAHPRPAPVNSRGSNCRPLRAQGRCTLCRRSGAGPGGHLRVGH